MKKFYLPFLAVCMLSNCEKIQKDEFAERAVSYIKETTVINQETVESITAEKADSMLSDIHASWETNRAPQMILNYYNKDIQRTLLKNISTRHRSS